MADLNLVFGVDGPGTQDEILTKLKTICKNISDSKQLYVKINAKVGKETTTAIRRQIQQITAMANTAMQQAQQANTAMQNREVTNQTRERTNATREQGRALTQIVGLYGRILDLTNQLKRENLSSAEVDQYTRELTIKQEELRVLNDQITGLRELHSLQGTMSNVFLQKESAGAHIASGDMRANLREYLSLYTEAFKMKQLLRSGDLGREQYAAVTEDRNAKLERMRVLYAGISQDQKLLNDLLREQSDISRGLTTKQFGVDYKAQQTALSNYLTSFKQLRDLQNQLAAPGATEQFKSAAEADIVSKRKQMASYRSLITDQGLLNDLKKQELVIEKELAVRQAKKAKAPASDIANQERALKGYLGLYKNYTMMKAQTERLTYTGGAKETQQVLENKLATLGVLKKQITDADLLKQLDLETKKINDEILLQKTKMAAQDEKRLEKAKDFNNAYTTGLRFLTKSGTALQKKSPEKYQEFSSLMNSLQAKTFIGTPKEATEQVNRLIAEYEHAGYTVETFGDKVRRIFSSKYVYGVITYAAFMARRLVREVFKNVKEVDSAMTQLSIVTGQTGSTLDASFDRAASSAKKLGSSITDLLSSMETFARLGYDMDQSQYLAEVATMMSKVASVDIGEATTGLTSIIKGFGLEAEDAEYVGDVLSNIGKKYAVSAGELMEAFERSGAAFKATGTDFEKATALIAAGNAAVDFCRVA